MRDAFWKNTNFPQTYYSVFNTMFFLTVINHSQYVLLPAEYSSKVSTIIIFVSAALLPNMKGNNMLCRMCIFLDSFFIVSLKTVSNTKHQALIIGILQCTRPLIFAKQSLVKFWTHQILMKNNPAQPHNSRRLVYVVDLSFIAYQSSYMNLHISLEKINF